MQKENDIGHTPTQTVQIRMTTQSLDVKPGLGVAAVSAQTERSQSLALTEEKTLHLKAREDRRGGDPTLQAEV